VQRRRGPDASSQQHLIDAAGLHVVATEDCMWVSPDRASRPSRSACGVRKRSSSGGRPPELKKD
jgi:hypothetical protein